MKVMDIVRNTHADVVVETCGIQGRIVFDSAVGTFKEYKDIKSVPVQRIEPESDGGRKFLHLYVIDC